MHKNSRLPSRRGGSRALAALTAALTAALAATLMGVLGPGLRTAQAEPLPADDPIRSAPNVILTPHHASFSDEAMVDLRKEMVGTTVDFMTTGWSSAIVNPEVRDRLKPPNP